ncbi:MAG: hypothetical protein GY854_05195 [Deltaproteobacteria bacterium]|nr:hypothetical protein [Deltaproteobacteria bacterium]
MLFSIWAPLRQEDGDEHCDVDILFAHDASDSMMDAVTHLTNTAFPQFESELSSYQKIGKLHVGLTNHLFGESPVKRLSLPHRQISEKNKYIMLVS